MRSWLYVKAEQMHNESSIMKKRMRHTTAWLMFLTLTTALLLSACEKADSNRIIVFPYLEKYEPEVQLRAAEELETLPPSCPRTHVIADCSAVRLLVNDYGTLRERIRKGGE